MKEIVPKISAEMDLKLKIITGKGNRSNNIKDPYKSNKLGILKYSVPEFIQGEK